MFFGNYLTLLVFYRMSHFFIILALFLSFAADSYAEDETPQSRAVISNQPRFGSAASARFADIKQAIEAAKQDSSIGRDITERFGSQGSEFNSTANGQRAYQENPFKYANVWSPTWHLDELTLQGGLGPFGMDIAMPTFGAPGAPGSCAEWTELRHEKIPCILLTALYVQLNYPGHLFLSCDTGRPEIGTPGAQMWEYWRAENQYEANNFGISEVMDIAGRHPILAQLKELNLLQGVGARAGGVPLGGLVARGGDARPAGLKAAPHLGNSHFEGSGGIPTGGMYSQFETRVVRTAHDAQRSLDYDQGDPFAYLRECMPPRKDKDITNAMFTKKKRFAFFNSERIPDLWRLPELSDMRYQGAEPPYMQLYGKAHELTSRIGQAYYANSFSPQGLGGPRPQINLIAMNAVCGSYWLNARARYAALYAIFGDAEFPIDRTFQNRIAPINPGEKDDWRRICYHPSMGALYPLVGTVDAESNTLAPIMAIRRFMDWTSWKNLAPAAQAGGVDRRTNHMDGFLDPVAEAIFKDFGNVYHRGPRRPDKIQRLNPAPMINHCVGMSKVHPRNPLFAQNIMPPGFRGSWRYAHWNRRKGCVCSEGRMLQLATLKVVPFYNVCIPVEE